MLSAVCVVRLNHSMAESALAQYAQLAMIAAVVVVPYTVNQLKESNQDDAGTLADALASSNTLLAAIGVNGLFGSVVLRNDCRPKLCRFLLLQTAAVSTRRQKILSPRQKTKKLHVPQRSKQTAEQPTPSTPEAPTMSGEPPAKRHKASCDTCENCESVVKDLEGRLLEKLAEIDGLEEELRQMDDDVRHECAFLSKHLPDFQETDTGGMDLLKDMTGNAIAIIDGLRAELQLVTEERDALLAKQSTQ